MLQTTGRQGFVTAVSDPEPHRCSGCGFVFSDHPVTLSRRLSGTAVGYERAAFALLAVGGPGDENGWSPLDWVVHVRDGLYRYATWLERLADTDQPVFGDLDPEPIPPVALDHTWGALTGLITNVLSRPRTTPLVEFVIARRSRSVMFLAALRAWCHRSLGSDRWRRPGSGPPRFTTQAIPWPGAITEAAASKTRR